MAAELPNNDPLDYLTIKEVCTIYDLSPSWVRDLAPGIAGSRKHTKGYWEIPREAFAAHVGRTRANTAGKFPAAATSLDQPVSPGPMQPVPNGLISHPITAAEITSIFAEALMPLLGQTTESIQSNLIDAETRAATYSAEASIYRNQSIAATARLDQAVASNHQTQCELHQAQVATAVAETTAKHLNRTATQTQATIDQLKTRTDHLAHRAIKAETRNAGLERTLSVITSELADARNALEESASHLDELANSFRVSENKSLVAELLLSRRKQRRFRRAFGQ